MDRTEDELQDMIVLEDEDGKEEEFRILFDALFVGDRQYVVLMPVNQENDAEPEIVILRVEEVEGGETTLVTIEDDDEWEEVLKELERLDIEENLGDYEVQVDADPHDDCEEALDLDEDEEERKHKTGAKKGKKNG